MMKSIFALVLFGLSQTAFADRTVVAEEAPPSYTLSIVNPKMAKAALVTVPISGVAKYMQYGEVVVPSLVNWSAPFCLTVGDSFRLDTEKTYRVLGMMDEEILDGVFVKRFFLETHSSDPAASFTLSCLASSVAPTMDEVREALDGIYEITPSVTATDQF